MRVALIGGVAGHAEALEAALLAARRAEARRTVVLGDVTGTGSSPDRVIERLRAEPALAVVSGPLDRWVLGREEGRAGGALEPWLRSARRRLSLEQLAWLEDLPERLELELGGWQLEVSALGPSPGAAPRLDWALPPGPGRLTVRVGAVAGWWRSGEGLALAAPSLLAAGGPDPRARWALLTLPPEGAPELELRAEPYALGRELERVEKLVRRGELDRRSGLRYARDRLGERAGSGRILGPTSSLAPVLVELARAVYGPLSGRWPDHDVPMVHEVRVSTRRLQEALQLLRVEGDVAGVARAIRRLRTLRRRLAARRAIDVQLASLHEQIVRAELSPAERRALVSALERRRHRVSAPLLSGRVRAKYARHGLYVLELAMGAQQAPWRPRLATLLGRRAGECRRLQSGLEHEHDAPAHHELRKAMKRLRYACELAALAVGDGAAEALLTSFRPLQDQLGHYNDMYEMGLLMDTPEVSSALEPAALARLGAHFLAERHQAFGRARDTVHAALPPLLAEVDRLGQSLPER